MIKLSTDAATQILDLSPVADALKDIKSDSMAGWISVPLAEDSLNLIKQAAQKIQSDSDYLVCIGIGGSFLGHKALIDMLGPVSCTKIVFAGNSLSSYELNRLFAEIGNKDFSINVISKSGTTTEPAIAFRIFKSALINKYGEKAASARIYATTDAAKGALHDEAVKKGYNRFIIPDDIGGRYSVLTSVGLLPLAVAGVDIDSLLAGARSAAQHLDEEDFSIKKSPALVEVTDEPATNTVREAARYAIIRQKLYREQGKETEILASFEPRVATFNEWWKQLFGESEGKNNQGIFPASVIYTTDLHSLGQYMQQGRRNLFETVLKFSNPSTKSIIIPSAKDDLDGLNYLAGKTVEDVNNSAMEATIRAHRLGGIPVLQIEVPDFSAQSIGELIYFFELSCAISARLSGVNPFDQPGVETYKQNMFKLLGKPGF